MGDPKKRMEHLVEKCLFTTNNRSLVHVWSDWRQEWVRRTIRLIEKVLSVKKPLNVLKDLLRLLQTNFQKDQTGPDLRGMFYYNLAGMMVCYQKLKSSKRTTSGPPSFAQTASLAGLNANLSRMQYDELHGLHTFISDWIMMCRDDRGVIYAALRI